MPANVVSKRRAALSLRAEPRLAQDEVGVLAGSKPRTVAAVRAG
jgi:hypothetical protein